MDFRYLASGGRLFLMLNLIEFQMIMRRLTLIRLSMVAMLLLGIQACGGGGGSNGTAVPDWVISVDTNDSGTPLNNALLGHYDLSGTLYDYDLVGELITNMQAVGFSEWRVSVGRWEISTEMLPTLTDSSACPIDPVLTNQTATDLDLINARSWFTDNGQPVTLIDTQDDARYNLAYVRGVIDKALVFGAIPFVSIDLMPLALSANRIPNRTDCTTSFMNAVSNHWPAEADNLLFSQAVVGLVKRIVEGDSGEAGRPVTHWEIWNEPEFGYFWHEGLAAHTTEFFNMATFALLALDEYRNTSTDPNVQNLKFGLASFASAATAVAALQAYDVSAAPVPMDFISFHSYHNDPLAIAADIELVANAAANSTNYQDIELVLAEWGSDLALTAGDADYANSMQPPLLMSSAIAMGAALGLDRAHHSIFYDFHPGVKLGLIDNNGQPKPLYRAYELLSESITAGSVMLIPGNATNNQLTNNGTVLVTRDSGGSVRALIINRDTASHTARLENLAGIMTPVQIKVFDDHAGPVAIVPVSSSEIAVPAQSLVLIEY